MFVEVSEPNEYEGIDIKRISDSCCDLYFIRPHLELKESSLVIKDQLRIWDMSSFTVPCSQPSVQGYCGLFCNNSPEDPTKTNVGVLLSEKNKFAHFEWQGLFPFV